MDGHDEWRAGWLREQPPSWPRRDEEEGPGARRWRREPEPYEDRGSMELYPGGTVMDDLLGEGGERAALRILARYTVARTVALVSRLDRRRLRQELRLTNDHLALLPAEDWERQVLERVTALCAAPLQEPIVEALIAAAEASAKREHNMGAFALYRSGYELAVARGWWGEAAVAARGIARLARLDEARHSARLWDRRGSVLERRAARASSEEAPAT